MRPLYRWVVVGICLLQLCQVGMSLFNVYMPTQTMPLWPISDHVAIIPFLPLLEAAAPAIGAAVSGLTGAIQSRSNVDKTIQANRELAQYQYSKDLEMWNRANEYNSPQAQMERLKAAGLNPHLIYGSGSASGGMAQQLPKYNAPTASYDYTDPFSGVTSVVGAYQDFQLKAAQIDALKAQSKVRGEDFVLKEFENQILRNVEDRIAEEGPFKGIGAVTAGRLVKTEQAVENWALTQLKRNREKAMSPFYKSFAEYQSDFLKGRNQLQAKAIDKMQADIDLTNKKVEFFLSDAIARMLGPAGGLISRIGAGGAKAAAKAGTGTFRQNARKIESPWMKLGESQRALQYVAPKQRIKYSGPRLGKPGGPTRVVPSRRKK